MGQLESPETKPHIYDRCIFFFTMLQGNLMGTDKSFQEMVPEQLDKIEKVSLDP